jgi:hypothetical protein
MNQDPRQPAAKVVVDPYEVDARLHQLGVSRGPLIEAALQGDLHRRLNDTPDDFSATPGFSGWSRTLRVVRAELRKVHAWHNGDFLQIPVTFNETETMAVAVSTGNERTGLPGDDPSTNAKGPRTAEAVESAQGGLDFDDEEIGVDFWYLVTHATADGEVRAELSNPRITDEHYQILGWHERILLGRIDPDGNWQAVPAPVAPSDITIDVSRKTA